MPVESRSMAARHADWLVAEGLSAGVGGLMATRAGGVSDVPYRSMNLRPPGLRGDACDDPVAVLENQRRFAQAMEGARPVYLDQVHGARVVRLAGVQGLLPQTSFEQADASITTERGLACTVLVADCLPVLFSCADGLGVGAAHAGWRGLAAGVLENTVEALCEATASRPEQVQAWLGACIGARAFEVGEDVRNAFGPAAASYFQPGPAPGKWWADLAGLARWRLSQAGVSQVSGGGWCTFSDASRFFSFRRDRVTGRHAAAIWRR